MGISIKQRRWILGGTLLLTVAAAASVGSPGDQDGGVVQVEPSRIRVQQQGADQMADVESSAEILVDRLKRPAMPEKIKDVFTAKSWYVPPPVSNVRPVPSAPPLPFIYIGKMLEEGNKYSVFLERQSRTYIVSAGEKIDVNYRVDTIIPPVMTLTYLPLDIKQTVQIGVAN